MNSDHDPADDARRIGDAIREAHDMLDDLDNTPLNQMDLTYYMTATWILDVSLRELLDALAAVTAPYDDAPSTEFTDEEKAFAVEAGLAPAFTGDDVREAQDWLVWSAVRTDASRRSLGRLEDLNPFDVIPGLAEVVAAFPPEYTDLDQFTQLQRPRAELRGLSVIQWLLTGGDVSAAVSVIEEIEQWP